MLSAFAFLILFSLLPQHLRFKQLQQEVRFPVALAGTNFEGLDDSSNGVVTYKSAAALAGSVPLLGTLALLPIPA